MHTNMMYFYMGMKNMKIIFHYHVSYMNNHDFYHAKPYFLSSEGPSKLSRAASMPTSGVPLSLFRKKAKRGQRHPTKAQRGLSNWLG